MDKISFIVENENYAPGLYINLDVVNEMEECVVSQEVALLNEFLKKSNIDINDEDSFKNKAGAGSIIDGVRYFSELKSDRSLYIGLQNGIASVPLYMSEDTLKHGIKEVHSSIVPVNVLGKNLKAYICKNNIALMFKYDEDHPLMRIGSNPTDPGSFYKSLKETKVYQGLYSRFNEEELKGCTVVVFRDGYIGLYTNTVEEIFHG